jgi:hypothetical protein
MVMRRISFLLLTALLALLPSAPALAQSTGGIRGTVLDKDGQPIVGAVVAIENKELGIKTGAPTDGKGEYRVTPLPPGKGYSVTVSFQGMATITQPDIEVTANKIVVVPITLRPSKELQTEIHVTAQGDVVNPEQTTTTTTISSEFLDALPILGRNYQDVLTLAPGVVDVNNTGNPNIHGARDTDVNTLIDGVSTVDPVTGRRGQEVGINTIQDIEVVTSGASAEFDRAQGGFVRLSTKSGGNDFEGQFNIDWRSNKLDGQGAGIDPANLHGGLGEHGLRDLSFNDLYPALTLSGPIVKDKAWYFVSAEYRQIETPVNALTQAFVTGHYENRLFGKFTWEMSTNHKLVFSAQFDPQKDDNQGLNSFTAINAGYTQYSGGRNLILKETAVFSPSVFLETAVADFVSKPYNVGTIGPDTNHNGVLFIDRNHDGFFDATERDPGEDYDKDGVFDVFEDKNHNGVLDANEDRDGDGRLTPYRVGCEGALREDIDCDGHLDFINEDTNHNGRLDPGEDLDGDGILDLGTEDRNHNQQLDDRPVPAVNNGIIPDENGKFGNYYPYHEAAPIPADQDYTQDFRTFRINGPYYIDQNGTRGRDTLRQDLTIYVPEWHGQHEMRTGYVVEREHFDETTVQRPQMFPNLQPATAGGTFDPTIGATLPVEPMVENTAKSMTGALYITDTYKPLPNLTLNLGVRFTREATDSFGYTPFDPVAERNLYDRLNALTGAELTVDDKTAGNNDGLVNVGICGDQLMYGGDNAPCTSSAGNQVGKDILNSMLKPKLARLTEHHSATSIVANSVASLFPDAIITDPVTGVKTLDRQKLAELGASFQEKEPFRLTNNNLAPRLAVSWDPWSDSKTKVFGSWGRFYDKLFLAEIAVEEGPDTVTRYYHKDTTGVTAGGIPDNGIGTAISKAPPSAFQIDRGLQTPFTDEWTVGFERELAPEVSLRINYINRAGRDGTQTRDINHVLRYDANGQPLDVNGRLAGGGPHGGALTPVPDGIPDLYVENFFFNNIYRLGNYTSSMYHGIETVITKRLSRKWQMETSYTYSRAKGDTEQFFSTILGNDPATIPYEYGYLTFDIRHLIRFNGSCFLPGDWTLGTVMEWHSGLPYSAITTRFSLDNFNYGQVRTLFGEVIATNTGTEFVPEYRDSRRNRSVTTINLKATKAFVMAGMNSKLNLAVENILNTDDLNIFFYQPSAANSGGNLQLLATRRFGRRYSIGFQFDF